jgi:NagD protein
MRGGGITDILGDMSDRRPIECWLSDMDGVLVHEGHPVPGADEFIQRLRDSGKRFLVLTNNSIYTPRDLSVRLRAAGLEVPPESIWTSALATAKFLADQRPEGSAYSFTSITRAIRLIENGARFIATNPDAVGPSIEGSLPACGAVAAMITKATGVEPYFVGKPNPMMMRSALNQIDAHSESTAMIGDRMDTDVVCGMEAGLHTILVLTGVTQKDQIDRFPFRPSEVVNSVADLIDLV